MAQYMTQNGYVSSSLGRAKTRARREAREYGRSYVENTESGKIVYRTNPARRNSVKRPKKKKTSKRIGKALSSWLKKQNPGKMKGVTRVRVKRLKGGGVTITPVR